MARLKITYLDVDAILLRETSQRKKPEGIEGLVDSIERVGLIHPIVVDEEARLVAGGNRLEAFKLLMKKDEKKWGKIPTVQRADLTPAERKVIELEENVKRVGLNWKDEAYAVLELDRMLASIHLEWTLAQRAGYIGYHQVNHSKWLKVAMALEQGHVKIQDCPTMTAAANILEREKSRQEDNVMNELYSELSGSVNTDEEDDDAGEPKEINLDGTGKGSASSKTLGGKLPNRQPAKPARAIVQTDFIEWAGNYTGPKFNFVHCDFPYGINHGKSDQGGAKGRWDSYNDSPDVYFALIRAMLENRDRIMLPSCHVMFWLSAKFSMQQVTRQMFQELAPDLEIDEYPLVWHKTDNKGIIRDVEHTPRHVYESAFWITRGNRQIIKAVADTYGAPTRKSDALHISEKPVPVLRHFMQLCIDGYSEVLDPTAGSGTALRAAHSMGAKRVLGLELNAEYAESAQREFEKQVAIETLRDVPVNV